MQTKSRSVVLPALIAAFGMGCATSTPYQEPVPTKPIAAADGEQVDVDRVIVLFDASGSIHPKDIFPGEKAWVESFVQGMPEGSYDAQLISFGGDTRRGSALSDFDREQLAATANGIQYIGEGSPLTDILDATATDLQGATGTTAVVLITDGLADDPEWGSPDDPVVHAARQVAEASGGPVCYHTVLAGDDPTGRALLQRVASTTDCGSFRDSSSLADAGGIESFQREMFIAEAVAAPVAVAAVSAAPSDLDRDGVIDTRDECPATPVDATVDDRGCWVLQNVHFASNSDEIVGTGIDGIAEVARVLNANPDLRIQIAGYTDSTGSAAYNRSLSERRAERVVAALEADGVDASRLEAAGYGEDNPIADNKTPEGRAENRRIEISVLR